MKSLAERENEIPRYRSGWQDVEYWKGGEEVAIRNCNSQNW